MQAFLRRNTTKLLLYSGLGLLVVALVIRGMGGATSLWVPVFGVAIALKTGFLVLTFRARQFRWHLWLILILVGVVMILVSLLFKYVFPLPIVRNLLFYGAITLKLAGLILLLTGKIKRNKTHSTFLF